METEDLVLDEGRQRKVVKEIRKVLPDVGVTILAQAFVVEAVDLSDLARFVVTAENGDSLWVADLECDEQSNSFD